MKPMLFFWVLAFLLMAPNANANARRAHGEILMNIGHNKQSYTAILPFHADAEGVIYVDSSRSGKADQDGSSWATALGSFQEALSAAKNINSTAISSSDSARQIWVTKGTYQPVIGASFIMPIGVKIYGSFNGGETLLIDRDLHKGYTSILLGNDATVVQSTGADPLTAGWLDGFKITGGKAVNGGGIYNSGCGIVLMNCSITDNQATAKGGGIYGNVGSVTLINVNISHNTALNGGGIMVYGQQLGCFSTTIVDNSAISGGGIEVNQGLVLLQNVTISGNSASNNGGGVLASTSTVGMTNSIIWGNRAVVSENEFKGDDCNLQCRSSILPIGSADLSLFGQNPGIDTAMIYAYAPKFVDTAAGNFRLRLASPAIDLGDLNAQIQDMSSYPDLGGNARIYNNLIDLGAYESQVNTGQIHNNGQDVFIGFDGSLLLDGDQVVSSIDTLLFSYKWKLRAVAEGTTDTIETVINPASYYDPGNKDALAAQGITFDSNQLHITDMSLLPIFLLFLEGSDAYDYWHDFKGTVLIQRVVGLTGTDDSVNSNTKSITIKAAALPVNIKLFSGSVINGIATLGWETGVESNLEHYQVQKSVDGKDFADLISVAPKGSNSKYEYNLAQLEPKAYYRLKIVENDKSESYYNHVLLLSGANADLSVSIQVFPNPASSYINIRVSQPGLASFYDALGHLVKKQLLTSGVNRIEINELNAGVYYGLVNGLKLIFVKK